MKVAYLSGGVGGARLARGLARALEPEGLTLVVNTADDFEHWGLWISPDLDTVMYTLAGLAHPTRGWGLTDETFAARDGIARLGGETWFSLSDQDLATHLMRTQALRAGTGLTHATARLCEALGVRHPVLPMCDEPVRTVIETTEGERLPFQVWFVQRRCEPRVRHIHFEGSPRASQAVINAIHDADAVLLGPSNPYVSIDPILSVPGVRAAVASRPVFAVSPIIAGAAVKGPLAEMIGQLTGSAPSAAAIARHYCSAQTLATLAGMVVQTGDEHELTGVPALATNTWMRSADDSERLARACLAFIVDRLADREPKGLR